MDPTPNEPPQDKAHSDEDRLPPLINTPIFTVLVLMIVVPLAAILVLVLGC
jgi:hypothetical protein